MLRFPMIAVDFLHIAHKIHHDHETAARARAADGPIATARPPFGCCLCGCCLVGALLGAGEGGDGVGELTDRCGHYIGSSSSASCCAHSSSVALRHCHMAGSHTRRGW